MDINDAVRHHQAGRFADAEKIYRQILQQDPQQPDALHLLGVLSGQSGQTAAAIDLIRQAIAARPEFPVAQRNLASLLLQQGIFDEAFALLTDAIRHKPDYAEAHNDLANLHIMRGQLDEAIAEYARAIDLLPQYAEAHHNLANALSRAGQVEAALAANARAQELRPTWAQAEVNRGEILSRAHRNVEAIQAFRRAVGLDPNSGIAWQSLGLALQSQGQFAEAAECFRLILQKCPDSSFAIVYRDLLETGPVSPTEQEISRLRRLLEDANQPAENRAAAGFALGTIGDRAGDFDGAFAAFARGNEIARQFRAAAGEIYDRAFIDRGVAEMIETFTPQTFQQRTGFGDPSELPVFVVGMPRSGTSLVQQIAAAHPLVYGAGELQDIPAMMKSIGQLNRDAASRKFDLAAAYRAQAAKFIFRLSALAPSAQRIIDKLPGNVRWLGLIAICFPNARVIFCQRDPRDTCLSCYFQSFATANTFSFDLADCAHESNAVARLIAHWKKVLPLKMLVVQYEDLVADFPSQSRRLIDFLGLPWDDACLNFAAANTTVQTASSWQVRQPIYQQSIGRWRHYAKHLQPLLSALSVD